MQNMLTIKEVADKLGYTPEVIRKCIKQGSIPCVRIHKQRIRIKRSWLDKVLADYPTQAEYNQALEDKRLALPEVEPKTEILIKPEIAINSEVIDMAKKKAETTEITTTKPKVKQFIPNPKKRQPKPAVEPDQDEPEYYPEPEAEDNDIFKDYQGIGNYDL